MGRKHTMFTISLQPSGLTLASSVLDFCSSAAVANIVKIAMFESYHVHFALRWKICSTL